MERRRRVGKVIYSYLGQLDRHYYVWVDSTFTHKEPVGFVPAIWFALSSYPTRVWGITVMLESGAIYRNLPPHAIAFKKDTEKIWTPKDAQRWDCYATDFVVIEYNYLHDKLCKVRTNEKEIFGSYLFTAGYVWDGFTAAPDQSKEFHFISTHGGRLTIQPTDMVVYDDDSFTDKKLEFPKGLKTQTEYFSCEK